MRLYFRRPSLALQDSRRKAAYRKFAKDAEAVDYAVALPNNRSLMAKYFPALHLRAEVVGAPDSALKLLVYSRAEGPVSTISAEEGPTAYQAAFPTVCAR
jgi:hypothetical protein